MAWFKIYAGSCNSATYIRTAEFANEEEAMQAAFEEAVEDYKSYEGYHGLLDREECREDLVESFGEEPTAEEVDERYQEEIESWIEYYVRPATSEHDTDDEEA